MHDGNDEDASDVEKQLIGFFSEGKAVRVRNVAFTLLGTGSDH